MMRTMTDDVPDDDPPARSRLAIVVGVAAVLVVAVLVGGFLYVTRDSAESALELSETTSTTGGPGPRIDPASVAGTWTVAPGEGDDATVAGYRIQEVFAAGARRATAVGRTAAVTGSLTVADGAVTEGEITVDTTTLESDQPRRDAALRSRGLQTAKFPVATFELTEPIPLPDLSEGAEFTASAVGDLTLHGVTRSVTVPLTVRAGADSFALAGSAPVVLADHDIEPPNVGDFVEVDDSGTLEFILNLERG